MKTEYVGLCESCRTRHFSESGRRKTNGNLSFHAADQLRRDQGESRDAHSAPQGVVLSGRDDSGRRSESFRNDEHIVRLLNTALTSEMRTAAMKDWTQLDDPIRVQQVEARLSEQDALIARLTQERDEAIAAAQEKADTVNDAKRKRASTAATPTS